MHALLLLRLAAPISSWDTLREITNDSVAHQKSISDSEMQNLMNRFEERRLQWVAASNTIEARARKSCVIPQATGWAELEADDFELPPTTIADSDSDSDSDDEESCEVRGNACPRCADRWVLCRCHQRLSSGNVTARLFPST